MFVVDPVREKTVVVTPPLTTLTFRLSAVDESVANARYCESFSVSVPVAGSGMSGDWMLAVHWHRRAGP